MTAPSTAANPLLSDDELIDFAAIQPHHVAPAMTELLAQAHKALKLAVSDKVPAEYDALALALDVPVERMGRMWAAINHLQSVADTPALRAAHAELLPLVTDFYTQLGSDEALFTKYKTLATSEHAATLSAAKQKVLADALRDFVLGGAELQGLQRERHAWIQARSAELSRQFGEHVLDAIDNFSHDVTLAELDGLPDDVIEAARVAAKEAGVAGYRLSLQDPCYRPVMQYANNQALRETMYRAYAQRASDLGPAELDNSALMRELVALRHEEAKLLGYASYADLSLVAKMARSASEVLGFIRGMAQRARPFAERDLADLAAFAKDTLGIPELQAWDRAYASEKLRQSRFAFSGQEVKKYFTEERVLSGLFALIGKLFDVEFAPAPASTWHPSVRFFQLLRAGQVIGGLYLDLHARAGKHSGAWLDEARQRWRRPDNGQLQLPTAHIVCNFAAPSSGQSGLLTHDDLITLFHEFGHGLHHLLTQVDEAAVSGIAGVEWDAAELPSQFMENFCWEWEVLASISSHVQTGETLPRVLFDRMRAARNFQSGMDMLRLAEYGLFDMRLHTEPGSEAQVNALVEEVRAEVAVVKAPSFYRYAHSFSHLFDGGYAAGFYGYAWAEVMSADAYAAFEEAGLDNPEVRSRYRRNILETGGSRSMLDNFKAFRGREPLPDALFRHQGMG